MTIFQNYPLIASICSILFAQFVKFPIALFSKKDGAHVSLVTSTGGMPSSHSSTVSCLSTCIAFVYGKESGYFAISVIFASIVMYDAMGIRRAAGKQAGVLNRMMDKLSERIGDMFHDEKLKELLGHTQLEVLVGMILGIVIAFIFKDYLVS